MKAGNIKLIVIGLLVLASPVMADQDGKIDRSKAFSEERIGDSGRKGAPKEEFNRRLEEYAKKNGLQTKTSEDGKVQVLDNDGNDVSFKALDEIKKIGHVEERNEKINDEAINTKLEEYAKENGLKTEKSEDGKVHVLDAEGKDISMKIVEELKLVPPPDDRRRVDFEMVNRKLEEYAKENGLKTEKSEDGKVHVLDAEGNDISAKIIQELKSEAGDEGDASDETSETETVEETSSEEVEEATSSDSPEDAIDSAE
ncbi:MAG: hypothetical protein AB1403_01170 [Candidatus Riflebacteria bacterium]